MVHKLLPIFCIIVLNILDSNNEYTFVGAKVLGIQMHLDFIQKEKVTFYLNPALYHRACSHVMTHPGSPNCRGHP